MKKFLLLILAIGLFSCGDDDNASRPAKLLQTVVMSGEQDLTNNVYTFDYDSQNRLISFSQTGYQTDTANFLYGENGKVSSATLTGSQPGTVLYNYDDQNRISSFSFNGDLSTVVHSGNLMTINDSFVLGFNSINDLQLYDTTVINYETSKNGPFADVMGFDPIILLVIEGNSPFYISKKAVSSLVGTNINYAIENTFDEDNFVSTSNYTGSNTFQINYFYQD